MAVKRRGVLAGIIALLAGAVRAESPLGALRPLPRPERGEDSVAPPLDLRPRARPSVQDIIKAADLGGVVGFVALDMATGREIESGDAPVPLPPASVTKVPTTLYALDILGPEHRFATRFIGTGPLVGDRLQGDLVLAGGGDPALLTDHLAVLVARLAATGLRRIEGRFLVWQGALPFARAIDPSQPSHLGYNPAVGGLNLNFNRVSFEWARSGAGYATRMIAHSDLRQPEVRMARIEVQDRDGDLFTYRDVAGGDSWTVRRDALGDRGSRWLPVRDPARYTAEVAQVLAADHGLVLPDAEMVPDLPQGVELARWESVPLTEICRDLLNFSTNLTAEVLGLAASAKREGRLVAQRASARAMALWVLQTTGIAARFVDHSGLQDDTEVSARAIVRLLTGPGAETRLRPILKPIAMTDGRGEVIAGHPVVAVAKTGTLNFVTTLAGYATRPGGGKMAFAIFAANPERRAEVAGSTEDWPPGAESWNLRARRMQQELLQRWGMRV